MSFKSYYDRLRHKIVERTNPYLGGLRRRLGGGKFSVYSYL